MLMIRPPPPLLDHLLRRRLGAQPRAGEVDGDDLVPAVDREVDERGLVLDAGVIDHDVEPTERLDGLVDQRLHLVGFGDVRLDAEAFAAGLGDLIEGGRALVAGVAVADPVDHHARPLGGHRDGDRLPDTSRRAGHDRHFVLELHEATVRKLGRLETVKNPTPTRGQFRQMSHPLHRS